MQSFIINIIGLVALVYVVMALFISIRDIATTKRKILWLPILAIFLGVIALLFATEYLPALILPLALFISVPIFITDKRRNWDMVDVVFRWVSIFALIAAAFIFLNYYFLR